jgi:hypothetical protein
MNWYHQIQHFKNAIVSAILQQNYSFDEANRPPSREFGYAERMNIRLQRSQTRAGIKFAASQEISFQGYPGGLYLVGLHFVYSRLRISSITAHKRRTKT